VSLGLSAYSVVVMLHVQENRTSASKDKMAEWSRFSESVLCRLSVRQYWGKEGPNKGIDPPHEGRRVSCVLPVRPLKGGTTLTDTPQIQGNLRPCSVPGWSAARGGAVNSSPPQEPRYQTWSPCMPTPVSSHNSSFVRPSSHPCRSSVSIGRSSKPANIRIPSSDASSSLWAWFCSISVLCKVRIETRHPEVPTRLRTLNGLVLVESLLS
jgi:hypothetical protein